MNMEENANNVETMHQTKIEMIDSVNRSMETLIDRLQLIKGATGFEKEIHDLQLSIKTLNERLDSLAQLN